MSVREMVLKYSTQGAAQAQRASQGVREEIQNTAQTAQEETGTINRWMERNKEAIMGIGAASAAALGGILASSPTFRAEMSSIRSEFSILADTIVNDVLPSTNSLSSKVADLTDAYRSLGEGIRKPLSKAIVAILALLSAAGGLAAIGGLGSMAKSGFLSAKAGLTVLGSAAKTLLAPALAVAKSALLSLGSLLAGLSTPVLAVIAVVAALGAAYATNFMGMRDKTNAFAKEIAEVAIPIINSLIETGQMLASLWLKNWGRMMEAVGKFTQKFSGIISGTLRPIISTIGSSFIITINILQNALETGAKWFTKFGETLVSVGQDAFSKLVSGLDGLISKIRDGVQSLLDVVAEAASKVPTVSFEAPELPEVNLDKFASSLEGGLDKGNNMLEDFQQKQAKLLAGEEAKNQVADFQDMLEGLEPAVNSAGKTMENLGTGMQEASKKVKNADLSLDSIAETAKKTAEEAGKSLQGENGILEKIKSTLGMGGGSGNSQGLPLGQLQESIGLGGGQGINGVSENPAQALAGGGGQGQTNEIRFEEGAVVVQGSGNSTADGREVGRQASRTIEDKFSARR